MKRLLGLFVCLLLIAPQAVQGADPPAPAPASAPAAKVRALKITVLSTMLADRGLGEWGYAALVEVDGRKILYDTGANPDIVLKNAATLGIDLSSVQDVVISHNHGDHTGGLITLRRELMKKNPAAMSRLHVAAGIFAARLTADGKDHNGFTAVAADYRALGGQVVEHATAEQIAPGVWFTGPVPRIHPEHNWSPSGGKLQVDGKLVEDNVPEDAALVFETGEGLLVLTGCGHAGIVNIAEYARTIGGGAPVFAVMGGLHLFNQPDSVVDWTGAQLKALGVKYLLAGHCTGIEATLRLRADLGLTRKTAPVSAVGSSFILGQGIFPGQLAA
jgi:7,8-dihydropterin-6-yl-methyl-4-(beta-D-ribofuranosyl)aminobenzene 5'-phosphate synthase